MLVYGSTAICPEDEDSVRSRRRWLIPVLVVLAVLAVLAALRLTQSISDADTAEQVEADLRRHTGGGAGEDAYDLAQTLIAEGVPHEEAVDVAAALSYLGGDVLDDLRTARLLAVFEQNAPTDAIPSRDLVRVAEQLEVASDGLWSFLNLVVQESFERETPADVMVEGLREHGLEYATGCELVEQAPCPVDVVVQLALDRQQADYEQWGYTDCRLDANAAHPGCLTFAACADEYAVVLAAQDADLDAWETARALGHEPGSAGWEEWTAATNETAQSSWAAHETCIAERYGEGIDAYKALVLAR